MITWDFSLVCWGESYAAGTGSHASATCGVVVCHPAALDADFYEGLEPLRLPVPHADAHRFGGSSESWAYMEQEAPELRLLLQ